MTNHIKTHTFLPGQALPLNLITPQQTHSANIVEIITGQENLTNCDGLWAHRCSSPRQGRLGGVEKSILLGVLTADCAPICVWNNEKFGIVHAGWRGTINSLIENLLKIFELNSRPPEKGEGKGVSELKIWVGPLLPAFEIQKDDCYDQIYMKFGNQFFTEPAKIKVDLENKLTGNRNKNLKPRSTLIFEFKKCLQHLLPPQAVFDEHSTFNEPSLASWRRDKTFPKGQNVTVIGSSNLF